MSLTFHANPAQYRYLRQIAPHRLGLFCAGWGIGKTTLLVETACILAGYNPGVKGFITSNTLHHVRVEIVPRLIARLKEFHNFKKWVRGDRMIYCRNGAMIQYASAADPDTLEGWNVGWALGDEIGRWRLAAHDKFMSRFRVKNVPLPFVGFFTTPEMHWMYDLYGEMEDPKFFLVRGSTRENAHNLREGFYEDLERRLSSSALKQYADGHWGVIAGAVFADFDTKFHIQDLEYSQFAPVDMGFDPGYRRPGFIFFQNLRYCPQHSTENCIHILDEICEDDHPTNKIAPMAVSLLRRRGWRRGVVYCDPAANSKNVTVGFSDVDVLGANGLECQWTTDPAARFVPNGIEVIRNKIKSARGETSLYIDKAVKEKQHKRGIIRALQRTRFPEAKGGKAIKDDPYIDEHKDALDSLRYPLVNLFPPLDSKMIIA